MRPRRVRPARALAALLPLLPLLAACGGERATGNPVETELRLLPVAGDAQRAVAGEPLPTQLQVRVLHADRRAAEGVRVRFTATGGGRVEPAEATTDFTGTVVATWTLGPAPAGGEGAQRAVAAVADAPAASVAFTAVAVDPALLDVVIVRGLAGRPALLVFGNPRGFDAATAVTLSAPPSAADSTTGVLRLIPFPDTAARAELTAFAEGRRPAQRTPLRWTPRADTVVVELDDPVPVPLTVWVAVPPFAVHAARALEHVEAARGIFRSGRVGAELVDVRVVDATERGATVPRPSAHCDGALPAVVGKDEGRMNAYYVAAVPGYVAYQCGIDWVTLDSTTWRWPSILAHEIGHTFGLLHETFGTENLMNTTRPGGTVTLGQAFRAQWLAWSSLNLRFGARPEAEWRDCRPFAGPACMPVTYAP